MRLDVRERRTVYLLQDNDTERTNPSSEYWEAAGERRVGSENRGTIPEPQEKSKRYKLGEKDPSP